MDDSQYSGNELPPIQRRWQFC